MFGNGGEMEQAAVEQAQLAERQRDLERVRSEAEWERKQRRRDEERRLEEVEYAALMEAAEMSLDLDPDLETDLETDLSETENEEEAESVALMEAAEAGLQLPGTVGSPSGSPMVRTQQDRAALASGSSAKGAGTSRAGRNPGGISNGGRVSPPIQAAAGLAAEEDDEDALVDELMLALMGGGLDPPVRVPGTAPSLGTAGLDPPIGVRGPGPAGPLPLRQGRAAAITGAGNGFGKLTAMKDARDAAKRGGGREIVVVKAATVDTELARLGLTLRRASGGRRMVSPDAFDAGSAAGEALSIVTGIDAA